MSVIYMYMCIVYAINRRMIVRLNPSLFVKKKKETMDP